MSANSQSKEVLRDLERQGFTVVRTRGGHWRIEHPDMAGPVFAAGTPSDHRALRNLLATIRRKLRPEPANDR